ncbi:MAG: TRAP transporter small permease [Pseudorhodoplanes sp.]|nr:TRAP transporter small permease [Pseudorhodoplanes sp.]
MKARYVELMNVLHRFCMVIAGACLVIITLIIPWGVFTRYVLNSASSWPEPAAVLLMIWFSFLSAAICYRESLHIGVAVVPMMLSGNARVAVGWFVEACMMSAALFMFWWGSKLVQTTWHQSIADFPGFSVGASYLPIPLGGLITALFVIEKLWTSDLFGEPDDDAVSRVSTE